VHAAAVSGLQGVLALSGVLGVLAGLVVLALMRSAPAPVHAAMGQAPLPGGPTARDPDGPVLIKL
jgi:hypothetical protein